MGRKATLFTPDRLEKLKRLYPTESKAKILNLLAPAKWSSIQAAAAKIGLRRTVGRGGNNRGLKSTKINHAALKARKEEEKRALSTEGAGGKWLVFDLEKLHEMFEAGASAYDLCAEFDRPIEEIIAEAERMEESPEHIREIKKQAKDMPKPEVIEKNVRAKVGIDLDVVLRIRNIRLETGQPNVRVA